MDSCDPAYQEDLKQRKSSGPITFTPAQVAKNVEAYSRIKNLLPFKDIYKVSDCDLVYRFLIGRHWNVDQAVEGILGYLTLRENERINEILGVTIEPEAESAVAELYGLDMEGHPVLWFRPDQTAIQAAMKKYDKSELTRANFRQMEQARYCSLATGKDRCTYVMDLEKVSMTSMSRTTIDYVRDLVKILQTYYPEIMRRLIICNAGWAVMTGWKILQPFVDSRIQDKLKFYNKAPTVEYLAPFISEENVHPRYGGRGTEDVLKEMLSTESQRVLQCTAAGADVPPPPGPRGQHITAETKTAPDLFSEDPTLYSFTDVCRQFAPSASTLSSSSAPGMVQQSEDTDTLLSSRPSDELIGSEESVACNRRTPETVQHVVISSRRVRSLEPNSAHSRLGSPLLPHSSSAPQLSFLCTVEEAKPTSAIPTNEPMTRTRRNIFFRSRHAVSGIPTRKLACKRISSFEWCLQLSLTYGSSGEIVCHHKGKRFATMVKSRVYASFPLQGVDNDDQDGAGALSHTLRSASPTTERASSSLSPALHLHSRSPSAAFESKHADPSAPVPTETASLFSVAETSEDRTHSERVLLLQRAMQQSNPVDWSGGASRWVPQSILCGEVLHESGHYLHVTLLVCDGERRVNFILKRSRLRNRITVFMVIGCNREVRTTAEELHYFMTDKEVPASRTASPTRSTPVQSFSAVDGFSPSSLAPAGKTMEELNREAIHVGTVVPGTTSSKSAAKDAWVMYGAPELVYQEPSDENFGARGVETKPLEDHGATLHRGHNNSGERNSVMNRINPNAKSDSATRTRLAGDRETPRRLVTDKSALRVSLAKWFPTITPSRASSVVVGEHKRQLLLFYGYLAYWYPPHDLFALGAAITRLWTMD